MKEETVTIQKTGKALKMKSLIGKTLFTVGLILVLFANEDKQQIVWGCLMVLFGFGYLSVIRIKTWWNHS